MADTLERTDEETDLRSVVEPDRPWITLVWNDPVNEMNYVAWNLNNCAMYLVGDARERSQEELAQIASNIRVR